MGFLNFWKRADINAGFAEYRQAEKAYLLDVRTQQEYRQGHIPGSINVPQQTVEYIASVIRNKEVPLYVYCYSGARSKACVAQLQRMGYSNVKNIGGIVSYTGELDS